MLRQGPKGDTRFGYAWLGFVFALALHVTDEATHDFISVYNPNARAIRAHLPMIPIPIFTLESFLVTLGLAILLLLCLSPLAFAGSPTLRKVAIPAGIIFAIANALLHLGSSLYYSRWMPGSYSSPILLLSGIFLFFCALRPNGRPIVQAVGL
jgi:hypothetical protein